MKLDTKAIRERCEKATKGPWAWESVAEKSNEYVVGIAVDAHGKPLEGCINEQYYDEETTAWVEDDIIRHCEIGANESGHANFSDADFIAHARTDLPACLDRIEELERVLRKCEGFQPRIISIMQEHGYKFERFPRDMKEHPPITDGEKWEALAFSMYCDLCEIMHEAKRILEGE